VPRLRQRPDALLTRLGEISAWQTAERDDAKVALEVHETRAVDRVYALDQAAFFDELFHYIGEIGAWPLFEQLDPDDRKGALYPFMQFVLFTIMRCVGGVQSMLATHELLLTDEALMSLLGFNAAQVAHGSTERGLGRRTSPVEIRGPFSYETVADNIVKLGTKKLETMFNGVIRCLAAQGIFPKHIDAILDATDDEATPSYETDDGREVPRVRRDKRPEVRANRHAAKVEVTVFGWKVWIVWEGTSKIPLALRIDGINVSDNEHALAVLQQAKANVTGHSTLRSVALDRGFLDGKLLLAIEREDMLVYIPSKSDMNITKDAREIARRAAAEIASGRTLDGCVVFIAEGDDVGRERLIRYCARPAIALGRLTKVADGRYSYRTKYGRGDRTHRVMTGPELMARIAALVPSPRHPLLRYHGVFAPGHCWRRLVVPQPRRRRAKLVRVTARVPTEPELGERDGAPSRECAHREHRPGAIAPAELGAPSDEHDGHIDVLYAADTAAPDEPAPPALCSPFILTDEHLRRLLDGVLLMTRPTATWAHLLRRSHDIDVLSCPKCHGRLRLMAVLRDEAQVRRVLRHFGKPTDPPPRAKARDPADERRVARRSRRRRTPFVDSTDRSSARTAARLACHMGKRLVRRPGAGPERTTRPSIPPPSNSMRITVSAKGAWIGYPPYP